MAAKAVARNPRSPDKTDIRVGHLIRVERLARGLSQTELASEIGVTFQQLQKYESGANRVSVGRLTRIGRVLGLSTTYFLGGDKRSAPRAGLDAKNDPKLSEGIALLGRTGAMRLLKAFQKIPGHPPGLRENIIRVVERIAQIENA
jgi:transcriptional regulator with XRE-family HTH domain